MWKRVAIYGALLALGTLALQWLDYQRLARAWTADIYVGLIAVRFLGRGLWPGVRAPRGTAGARPPAGHARFAGAWNVSPGSGPAFQYALSSIARNVGGRKVPINRVGSGNRAVSFFAAPPPGGSRHDRD